MSHDVALSVVVPAHDEAPNLERLVAEIRAALDPAAFVWELVIVDDGSTDETASILAAVAVGEPRLRAIRLPRRSGQTRALDAGFRDARGTLLATLDADLQCPPSALPGLVRLVHDGEADLACGVRTRRHDPPSRLIVSAVANAARRCLIAPMLRDLACPLRVLRADAFRAVTAAMPLFDGAHRWLPALFTLAGLRVVQRPVPHGPRTAGVSKYTTRGRLVPIARETCLVVGLVVRQLRGWRCAPVRAFP